VTQQNAANAEESASAAEEMSAQAETMQGMVGELVAIVGSAGKGHDEARAKKKSGSKVVSRRKAAKPAAEAIIPLDQSEELSNF
jgi:methyl-accepting chemotaxis protein